MTLDEAVKNGDWKRAEEVREEQGRLEKDG